MKKNKTVVFFNGYYLPHLGGVEQYTYGLASALKSTHNVYIVTANVPEQKTEETVDGITIFRLPTHKALQERFPILRKNSSYKELVKKIKTLDISNIIINTRYYSTTILGLRIAKEKGIKPIIIDHSSNYILKPYELFQNARVLKYHPVFYTVSECTAKWLKSINIKSNGVFYNSVDAKKDFKKGVSDKVRIIFAGRLLKEKGVKLIVAAYEELKNNYNIELCIIGNGPLYDEIKNNHPDVILTGKLSHKDTLEEFKKSDIFAFPTLYPEGFPTVILEAAMAKCAIISTDRGGVRELISNDEVGIILKNDASDLKQALKTLLDNPKQIHNLGENVFKIVNEKFTWEKTIKNVRKELEKYEGN